MGFEILLMVLFFLLLANFIALDLSVSKMKKDNKSNIEMIGLIIALEKAMKKLNAALKSHDRRLDNHLHEISDIKDRLDILESGHPDSDIDYATLDDHDEVVEVWFHGKKYVPEDKRDEDTVTFYADDRIVAETAHMAKAIKPEECLYIAYKNMGGNDKTEELLKRVEDLNYFYNVGLMSATTYMHRWEELMQNDT